MLLLTAQLTQNALFISAAIPNLVRQAPLAHKAEELASGELQEESASSSRAPLLAPPDGDLYPRSRATKSLIGRGGDGPYLGQRPWR
jgi:hypothetical protein